MTSVSFQLHKERQIAIRQGVDNDSIGDNAREAGHLLPAWRVLQERIERQRWESQSLYGKTEAVQHNSSASQPGSSQKPSAPCRRSAISQQESWQQPEEYNFHEQELRPKWSVDVELPRRKPQRRRRDVQPDQRVNRLGDNIDAKQSTGDKRQALEHFARHESFASNLLGGRSHENQKARPGRDRRQYKKEECRRPEEKPLPEGERPAAQHSVKTAQ